jgi:hypothetical protein
MSRVVPRFWQRCRRSADRRRGKASPRWRGDEAAKFFPARGMRLFIPSLGARPRSNYLCARGRKGKQAFIACGYRREYWPLTLPLTILPTQ